MEKTIEIPEGYEARIEGNKVILEPKESDDERIMKDIITALSIGVACDESALYQEATTTLKEAIAYLEKHKEQQPAEWSEEDKVMLNNIIWGVHIKSIIKPLYEMDDRSKYKKYEDFLKSLPERFNLQPKQEWSEEDEDRIRQIERIAQAAGCSQKLQEEIHDWLKSRRPQPHTVSIKNATKFGNLEYERGVKDGIQSEKNHHWKPSEEQMEALKDVIDRALLTCRQQGPLESLLDELRKLI